MSENPTEEEKKIEEVKPSEPQTPDVQIQGEESATAKIKAEVLEIAKTGKDLASKEVYPQIAKDLAKKYNVTYPTAASALKKALRESNQLPEITPIPKSTRTVGNIKINVSPSPKQVDIQSSPTLPTSAISVNQPSQSQGVITFTAEDYIDIVNAANDKIKESKHLKDQALSESEIKLLSKAIQKSLEKRVNSGADQLGESQLWGVVIGEIVGLRVVFWLIDKGFDLYDKWAEDKKRIKEEEKKKPEPITVQGQSQQ